MFVKRLPAISALALEKPAPSSGTGGTSSPLHCQNIIPRASLLMFTWFQSFFYFRTREVVHQTYTVRQKLLRHQAKLNKSLFGTNNPWGHRAKVTYINGTTSQECRDDTVISNWPAVQYLNKHFIISLPGRLQKLLRHYDKNADSQKTAALEQV